MGSRLEKNSDSVRKRIEAHSFDNEDGDEYEGSKFGGFPEYFRRKRIKLQNLDAELRSKSADKPQIFKGIVVHVNGYTQPSLNDLHKLIVSHGGGFMQYLDGKTTVTHIIAASLTPKKAIEFRRYRIVKPAWIVDSVAAGKVLPWDAYRVIDEGSGQRLLGFDDGKMVSQVNTQQRGYRDQTNTSWYTSQVKSVVDDIDDEDGAQFPSTQKVAFDGTGEFIRDSASRNPHVQKSPAKGKGSVPEEIPESSGDFEVSSSLEDALKTAAIGDAAGRSEAPRSEDKVGIEDRSATLQPSEIVVENIQEGEPQGSITPTKSRPFNLLKRPHETESPSPSKKSKVITAEEHNALLLADPHLRKSSTANPEFLKQYYAESRLHHMSTWKADLKSRFQQMAAEKSASQRQLPKRKPGDRRYIMHVDFDSFFCAVSLKSAPEYVDKPAVVAHGSGSGSEIASCNYPARAFGIKNGMWMKKAQELCSSIKVLPYDFPAYEAASRGFYETIIGVGGTVQSVSVDEALVDITSLCMPTSGTEGLGIQGGSILREQEKADQIADTLRKRIKEVTGCAVSVGIGGNILLAKVALRKAKPAGQHQIRPEEVLKFIGELTVQDLPGVAYSIGGKLEEIGVKFVKDVRQLTKDRLMTVLGPRTGEKIWDYSRGIDRTEVGEQTVRKSVSAEVNWGIRFISQPEAEEFVLNLCKELQRRLINEGVKGRQFTMKIMRKSADAPMDPPKNLGHGKCDTFNKSIVLGVATNSAEVVGREAISVLRSYGFSPGELRGLGVQMTKLELLKPSNTSLPDGSQRRINWGAAAPKLGKQINEDPTDDPQTPAKARATPTSYNTSGRKISEDPIDEAITPTKSKPISGRLLFNVDPIDDFDSPKKAEGTPQAIHPAAAIARANAADQSATKVLNVMGTQFIIPSQIDPRVLSELPQDIRSKLMAQSKNKPIARAQSPALKSRSNSPFVEDVQHLPSQLDPEVFDALPEDVKAEVLASYGGRSMPVQVQQGLLPQSPRKGLHIIPPKRTTPTKKRGRGRPPGSRNGPRIIKPDKGSHLTQANFVAHKGSALNTRDQPAESDGYASDTLDPEFLSALPEEMRQEVMNEHRRKRLAKKGGLMTTVPVKKRRPPDLAAVQRKIRLPPREPRPTFTTQELSTLPELRSTLSAWYQEFADDGPHPDDVAAMERYLRRVVLDERDMGKVVAVVKWMQWLLDESDEGNEGTRLWGMALEGIKEKVQDAVKERGLGRLEL